MQSKIDVSIACTIEGTAINTNCMKGNAECNIVCLSARIVSWVSDEADIFSHFVIVVDVCVCNK